MLAKPIELIDCGRRISARTTDADLASWSRSSGTTALRLAFLGVGVGIGDELLLPSLFFGAMAVIVGWGGRSP